MVFNQLMLILNYHNQRRLFSFILGLSFEMAEQTGVPIENHLPFASKMTNLFTKDLSWVEGERRQWEHCDLPVQVWTLNHLLTESTSTWSHTALHRCFTHFPQSCPPQCFTHTAPTALACTLSIFKLYTTLTTESVNNISPFNL